MTHTRTQGSSQEPPAATCARPGGRLELASPNRSALRAKVNVSARQHRASEHASKTTYTLPPGLVCSTTRAAQAWAVGIASRTVLPLATLAIRLPLKASPAAVLSSGWVKKLDRRRRSISPQRCTSETSWPRSCDRLIYCCGILETLFCGDGVCTSGMSDI